MNLRPATPADLPAIRDLQIASWQTAYRGILTDAFLEVEVPKVLAQRWAEWPGPDWRVRTVWQGADLQGFVSLDLARNGGAYVDNLHVLPTLKGHGIGRRLMAAAASDTLAEGPGAMWLTVMEENTGARTFYRRIGGQERSVQVDLLFGQPVNAIPVQWEGAALEALAGV